MQRKSSGETIQLTMFEHANTIISKIASLDNLSALSLMTGDPVVQRKKTIKEICNHIIALTQEASTDFNAMYQYHIDLPRIKARIVGSSASALFTQAQLRFSEAECLVYLTQSLKRKQQQPSNKNNKLLTVLQAHLITAKSLTALVLNIEDAIADLLSPFITHGFIATSQEKKLVIGYDLLLILSQVYAAMDDSIMEEDIRIDRLINWLNLLNQLNSLLGSRSLNYAYILQFIDNLIKSVGYLDTFINRFNTKFRNDVVYLKEIDKSLYKHIDDRLSLLYKPTNNFLPFIQSKIKENVDIICDDHKLKKSLAFLQILQDVVAKAETTHQIKMLISDALAKLKSTHKELKSSEQQKVATIVHHLSILTQVIKCAEPCLHLNLNYPSKVTDDIKSYLNHQRIILERLFSGVDRKTRYTITLYADFCQRNLSDSMLISLLKNTRNQLQHSVAGFNQRLTTVESNITRANLFNFTSYDKTKYKNVKAFILATLAWQFPDNIEVLWQRVQAHVQDQIITPKPTIQLTAAPAEYSSATLFHPKNIQKKAYQFLQTTYDPSNISSLINLLSQYLLHNVNQNPLALDRYTYPLDYMAEGVNELITIIDKISLDEIKIEVSSREQLVETIKTLGHVSCDYLEELLIIALQDNFFDEVRLTLKQSLYALPYDMHHNHNLLKDVKIKLDQIAVYQLGTTEHGIMRYIDPSSNVPQNVVELVLQICRLISEVGKDIKTKDKQTAILMMKFNDFDKAYKITNQLNSLLSRVVDPEISHKIQASSEAILNNLYLK